MDINNLNNICKCFNKYIITNKITDINAEYIASTDKIYTDGNIKSNINKNGYIHITEVNGNPNYIAFINNNNETFIAIYRYAPDYLYTYILEVANHLTTSLSKIYNKNVNNKSLPIDNKLININKFKCEICNSRKNITFKRSKIIRDGIICSCNKCKSEYTLVPSKYYVLSSKKHNFFKSSNSRMIRIK